MRKLLLLALFAWCYDLYSQPTVVDLGLPSGTKWAKTNVGASNAQDYGNYYAWGEITPKNDYTWATYQHSGNSNFAIIKYCNNSEYGDGGFSDALTVLDAGDNVVISLYGAGYQIPTPAQWTELRNNCYWRWNSANPSVGYDNSVGWVVFKVKDNAHKGKIDNTVYSDLNSQTYKNSTRAKYSSADAHIFLPAAGCKVNTGTINTGSYGDYWSSTLGSTYPYCAQGLFFHSAEIKILDGTRYYGRTVRPVKKP